MKKNEAAQALGRLSVKKHPHLHTSENMKKLALSSAAKRKARRETAQLPQN